MTPAFRSDPVGPAALDPYLPSAVPRTRRWHNDDSQRRGPLQGRFRPLLAPAPLGAAAGESPKPPGQPVTSSGAGGAHRSGGRGSSPHGGSPRIRTTRFRPFRKASDAAISAASTPGATIGRSSLSWIRAAEVLVLEEDEPRPAAGPAAPPHQTTGGPPPSHPALGPRLSMGSRTPSRCS